MSEASEPDENGLPDGNASEAERTDWAVNALSRIHPELSSSSLFPRSQRLTMIGLAVVVMICLVLAPRITGITLLSVITVMYLTMLVFRLVLLGLSLEPSRDYDRSDADALAFPTDLLPTFSIIVPAYKEPEVIAHLVKSLGELDYPKDKLEILLALEADDHETIDAAQAVIDPTTTRIVAVPASEPRTKPKALNYVLGETSGEMITIYDAEDRPEPLQLRRAAIAMHTEGERMACVQAQLSFFNPTQNMVTKWFTLDYAMWFARFLPGLLKLSVPIPLGGTSNHFRKSALIEVSGWDPHNVTEDADLGIRLYRFGYRVGVISSVTLEEANSDVVNWVKQRSRWYKGYFQTWLIHMRQPKRTHRELGGRGFAMFNLFIGGTPMLAVLNPVFWTMTIMWFMLEPEFIRVLFPPVLLHLGIAGWVIGNFLLLYAFILTALERPDVRLLKAAFFIPAYYVMMSLAAYKALIQLITAPSYWEKTVHGLDKPAVITP
jgi:glycosyltransferase XagB